MKEMNEKERAEVKDQARGEKNKGFLDGLKSF
jgi:hypothetical protein